jgi:hypothetical protein
MINIRSNLSNRIKITLLIVSVFVITFSASCSSTGVPSLDEEAFLNAVDTAVAATDEAQELAAQLTKGAEAALKPSDTVAPTSTTAPNTPTLEPTLTPTTGTLNETPGSSPLSGPVVQVSVDTNCRSGPGKSYTWLGALYVGEEATITGKDPSGSYWYINNPDIEGEYCWIWGFYATISGNTTPLPIYTPGPTPFPQPNFSTDIHEVEFCGGEWQFEFTIVNNGDVRIESVSSYVKDTVTLENTGENVDNAFVAKTGCTVDRNNEKRDPGQTGYTVSKGIPNDPTGHLSFASLTVCTEDYMNGTCRTREFYFTP